jgi:serine/threonine protein phosphatase PrpC
LDVIAGYCSVSKPGRPNEDRFRILGGAWVEPDERASAFGDRGYGVLACVMDGVGGAPRGMEAAQIVADSFADLYRSDPGFDHQVLENHIRKLNGVINSWGAMAGTDRPEGATTLTLCWIGQDDIALILHVGDSVAFRRRGELFSQLTRDHTSGRGINRYVGQGAEFRLDTSAFAINEGDILCLASDGLTKGLSGREISEILGDFDGEPGAAATELVGRAQRRRVQDDITAIVLCFQE